MLVSQPLPCCRVAPPPFFRAAPWTLWPLGRGRATDSHPRNCGTQSCYTAVAGKIGRQENKIENVSSN